MNGVYLHKLELIMSRLSLEDVLALLEAPEQGEDLDPMEVVTPGSDEEMNAEYLDEYGEDYQFEGCK